MSKVLIAYGNLFWTVSALLKIVLKSSLVKFMDWFSFCSNVEEMRISLSLNEIFAFSLFQLITSSTFEPNPGLKTNLKRSRMDVNCWIFSLSSEVSTANRMETVGVLKQGSPFSIIQ